MVKRRMIRVFVPFSRSLYFNDKGQERGLTAELVRDFESKEMDVGDIHITEANIHAGSKYMDHLMTQYFKDAHFDEVDRTLFAFASYNAGPGRIARLRKEAAKRGLNPDKWFFNVEIVTSEKVGKEPVTYVRNIYKYYVAYRLMTEAAARRRATREQVAPAK